MVYITMQVIALDNFFAQEVASVHMCYVMLRYEIMRKASYGCDKSQNQLIVMSHIKREETIFGILFPISLN